MSSMEAIVEGGLYTVFEKLLGDEVQAREITEEVTPEFARLTREGVISGKIPTARLQALISNAVKGRHVPPENVPKAHEAAVAFQERLQQAAADALMRGGLGGE